jgi:transcriptional regulator with XRE-family HTH domain
MILKLLFQFGGIVSKLLREKVAENIRRLRVLSGTTQVELAKKAGLTDVYISRVEQNARNLTLDSVEQIARALKVPVIDLIGDTLTNFPKSTPRTAQSLRYAIRVLEAYLESIEK